MSEKQNQPKMDKSAGDSAEKKDAEGQIYMYKLECVKCGHRWESPCWDNYCPRSGCTGRARQR